MVKSGQRTATEDGLDNSSLPVEVLTYIVEVEQLLECRALMILQLLTACAGCGDGLC